MSEIHQAEDGFHGGRPGQSIGEGGSSDSVHQFHAGRDEELEEASEKSRRSLPKNLIRPLPVQNTLQKEAADIQGFGPDFGVLLMHTLCARAHRLAT
jgi:hypothetical protein